MSDFDNKLIELLNKNHSELLNPFHPVFPMPGMWHFIFGSILALIAFSGSYVIILDQWSVPIHFIFVSNMIFGLIGIALLILSTRGYLLAAKIILTYASISIIFLIADYIFGRSFGVFELIMLVFSSIALYLLTHRMNRTLLVIMAVRNQKIREMKKNGTYKQKLAEVRAKWNKR